MQARPATGPCPSVLEPSAQMRWVFHLSAALFKKQDSERLCQNCIQHAPMPSKQKINLEKMKASLDTLCPKCGYSIPPEKLYRVDSDHIQCPKRTRTK